MEYSCSLYFFTFVISLHLLIATFFNNNLHLMIAVFGMVFSIILIVLNRRGLKPKRLRLFILSGCNLYIFAVNLTQPGAGYLLYLLLPITFVAIFYKLWANGLMLAISAIEVTALLLLFPENYLSQQQSGMLIHFALASAAVLFPLYAIKFGREYNTTFKEYKKTDFLLTTKEGYLNLFLEYTEEAIVVFDLNQNILAVNPAFERMYGWTRQECIGRSPRLFPESEDGVTKERKRNLASGKSYNFLQTKEMRRDGTVFNAELSIAPIYDAKKRLVASSFIARDITLKLQAEKHRTDIEKMNTFGKIAAGVAHEVRNPMTLIYGFVQMMNNDPENPYRNYTELMSSEINRVDHIVSEFLVLSKPNIKKPALFDIEKPIRDVIQMFEPELFTRSIFITIEIPINIAPIRGNQDGMKQVFINLIKNSIEALKKNGTITVNVTIQEETVFTTISDNGPGMTQETLDNLFEPFYTTKPEGTGLGMLITKKIVVDQGGSITVSSELNQGTKTTITLPLSNK